MKKILNKILDEINKETPRLDYIRGLIEASVEEEEKIFIPNVNIPNNIERVLNNIRSDEETIPEAARIGPIANLA